MLKTLLLATTVTVASATLANAACPYEVTTPIKSLSAGFEAWKAVTDAMAECGPLTAELDQEFREKQPAAFAASPALYQIGGVANSTIVPLLNDGSIRPLDSLIEEFAPDLSDNLKITIDGETMAIAMMVNAQHLMYRQDILSDLGLETPQTYEDVLAAAEAIKEAGVVDYPLGGTLMPGFNLGMEFVNMYLGYGGEFFNADKTPAVNNETGVKALEMLKALTAYMDPEYLVSDSTYVQQQFQQGKIAMANLWASRAGAMDDEAESQVVGLVEMASAPGVEGGDRPASTIWWDGMVIAANATDEEAEAAFKLILGGLDSEMVQANNDEAVWLIEGYEPGRLAAGAAATAMGGAAPYPASTEMGVMLNAIGDNIADYLTDAASVEDTLAKVEDAYTTSAREAGLLQ